MTAMQTKLRRKQGRKSNGPPFVQLFKYMLKSPAWLSLATPAKAAYVQLAQRYDGVNNGMIALSVRTLAQELNCSRATAARALIELEDTGFIETVKLGTFARRNRRASEYRLTTFRCDVTGELPTKRFMQIKDAIGAIPTAKPWDAEGISRRTWYRRRGTVALPTVSPKECHGLKIGCQSANGTPTVSPEGQILCHGTPDGLTHETLIESHHRESELDAAPVPQERGGMDGCP
jgi:Helix-turn-helix domain